MKLQLEDKDMHVARADVFARKIVGEIEFRLELTSPSGRKLGITGTQKEWEQVIGAMMKAYVGEGGQ